MKIVQINTVFGSGSTGRIVSELSNSIKKSGNDSFVAYGRKTAPLPPESAVNFFLTGNKVDFIGHVLVNFFAGKNGFASTRNTRKLIKWIDSIKPDIIHLHNLHGFYLNVEILFEYIKARSIPTVWTLHDCWPFTGQCAYFDAAGCDRWIGRCHDCPIYRTNYPYSLFKDNSIWNYAHKKSSFTGVKNLTIVTPSDWLCGLVKQSFLKEYPVKVIPNGIDTEVFCPKSNQIFTSQDKSPTSFRHFSALTNKKIVLGVANIWSSSKGLNYLLRTASYFKSDPDYFFVIIGLRNKQIREIKKKYPTNVLPLKKTSSKEELAAWYRRADVFVNPTMEDNFPTTNLEALACGTPVITFNTGGSPESLTKDCGIIVERGNCNALKAAILSGRSFDRDICRKQAMNYTADTFTTRYISLYHSIYDSNHV